jgi:Spy/CpxP family protein refolding chaperone
MRGPRRATAARVPVAALQAGLKLTSGQVARIRQLQDGLRQRRDALMPRRGQGGGDGPPDPAAMRARFEKWRTAEQKAESDIAAVLSPAQKQALPGLLKRLDVWRSAGIPLELFGTLNLTGSQEQKIGAIVAKARAASPPRPGPGEDPGAAWAAIERARASVREQALAVLNPAQRKAVKAYRDAHPRPEFGRGRRGRPGPAPSTQRAGRLTRPAPTVALSSVCGPGGGRSGSPSAG